MKSVILDVASRIPFELEVIDVDVVEDARQKIGSEVPVLFIDKKKAFKYRVTAKELEKRLGKSERLWLSRLRLRTRKVGE